MLVSSKYKRAMSEINRLGPQELYAGEILVERLQRSENSEQRGPYQWFHHETTAFLSRPGNSRSRGIRRA